MYCICKHCGLYSLIRPKKKLKKENSTPNILLQGGQIGVDYKINFYIMNTKFESLSLGKFQTQRLSPEMLSHVVGGSTQPTKTETGSSDKVDYTCSGPDGPNYDSSLSW